MEEVALSVDDCWADMPLERLRRAGEIGWDIDPDGPTGPEKFDNVYNKARLSSHPRKLCKMPIWRRKVCALPERLLNLTYSVLHV